MRTRPRPSRRNTLQYRRLFEWQLDADADCCILTHISQRYDGVLDVDDALVAFDGLRVRASSVSTLYEASAKCERAVAASAKARREARKLRRWDDHDRPSNRPDVRGTIVAPRTASDALEDALGPSTRSTRPKRRRTRRRSRPSSAATSRPWTTASSASTARGCNYQTTRRRRRRLVGRRGRGRAGFAGGLRGARLGAAATFQRGPCLVNALLCIRLTSRRRLACLRQSLASGTPASAASSQHSIALPFGPPRAF